MLENKKPTYFHFFALKTDNSLFCYRYISTIHNGYCVSEVMPTQNFVKRQLELTENLGTYSQKHTQPKTKIGVIGELKLLNVVPWETHIGVY